MKESNIVSDLIRKDFAAFLSSDRETLEELFSDDFTFTSPRDNHISKTEYFERCFPGSEQFRALDIEKLSVQGNEVFVRYRAELKDGAKFRNVEYMRVEGNKIMEVEVYFGASITEE